MKAKRIIPEAEDTLCETRRRQPAAFHGRSVSASQPSARAAPGSPRCMHRPDRCITPLQFSAKGPQAEAMAPPSHPFGIDTNNSNPPRAARVSWFFCADLAPRPPIIAYPRNLPPPAVRFGVAWRPATGSGSLPSPLPPGVSPVLGLAAAPTHATGRSQRRLAGSWSPYPTPLAALRRLSSPPPSEALDRPRHRQPNILPIRLPLDAFRSAPFRCRCQGSGRPSLHRETGPRPVALLRAASLLQVARCPAHRLPKAKNAGLALPVAIGSLPNRIDCSLRRSRSLVAFCFRCS